MPLDRRRFLEITALGAAACLSGACREMTDERAEAASPGVTLNLTLWGGFLYAVSERGRRLEVACLTDPPEMPGYTVVLPRPALTLTSGAFVHAETTVKLGPDGEIPRGAYELQLPGRRRPAVTFVGLREMASACPSDVGRIRSLAHVPELGTLDTRVAANWRERFGTRFRFDAGELRARPPLHDPGRLPRWTVTGPASEAGPFPFTDTLLLSVPLPGAAATFVTGGGERLTIAPEAGKTTIEARLLAHPPTDHAGPAAADAPAAHVCSLYAVFDPVPPAATRPRLLFSDWCGPGGISQAPGPASGTFCAGAWREVPGKAEG